MKNLTLIILSILIIAKSKGQDTTQGFLKYNVVKNYFHEMPSGKKELYDTKNYSAVLYYKGNEILYKEISGEIKTQNEEKRLSNGGITVIPVDIEKTQSVVYKNYLSNEIVYSFSGVQGRLGNFLKDTIRIQNWESTTNDSLINNRKCTKFYLKSFYNTNWTAWIDLNTPFTDGPWRFSHSPGLIVELISDNDTQKYTLQEINLSTTLENKFLYPEEIKSAKVYNKTDYEKIEKEKKERIRLIMEQNNKQNQTQQ
jgi:GLPGLI family protein